VLAAAIGAALVLLAASRGWVTLRVARDRPLPDLVRTVRGGKAQPLLTAMGLVGLAGAVALLATRRIGRLVVGLLLAAAGVLVAVRASTDLQGMSAHRAETLLTDGGPVVGVPAGARATVDLQLTWVGVALTGAVLLIGAGAVVLARGRRWPGMGGRYERSRPATIQDAGHAPEPAQKAVAEADRTLWEALDRGEDPTAR